jgi:hypothetical protein
MCIIETIWRMFTDGAIQYIASCSQNNTFRVVVPGNLVLIESDGSEMLLE